MEGSFVWDSHKNMLNVHKHGVDFLAAEEAFKDPFRQILIDSKHSQEEVRMFCIGKVQGRILTVRFVYRGHQIRILGAGYWRKGARYYEKKKD